MSNRKYEGTDPDLELRVLKFILLREGLISKLKELANKKRFNISLQRDILRILTECRNVTVKLVRCVIHWRVSAKDDFNVNIAREFTWRSQNYLLKICNDMDFLSDCTQLIASLHITKEKMLKNPLMLPNNLDEARDPKEYPEDTKRLLLLNGDEESLNENKRKERESVRLIESLLVIEDRYIRFKKLIDKKIMEKVLHMLNIRCMSTLKTEKIIESICSNKSKESCKVVESRKAHSKDKRVGSYAASEDYSIPNEIICVTVRRYQ